MTDLVVDAQSHGVRDKSLHRPAADPNRGFGQEAFGHQARRPLHTGTVVYSVPYCNWYRVQLDGTGATVPCTMGGEGGYVPVGPRATGVIPPYSQVVVTFPPGRTTGVILVAYPVTQHNSKLACPDWISQGGQSGVQREGCYRGPFETAYREGGVQVHGSNRPLDSTIFDWGRLCETGLGLNVDPFMGFLRASEVAGIWVHYHDDYVRLAGWNMDWQTAVHNVTARLDEGENHFAEGHSVYPWESLGLYASGTRVSADFSPEDVQFAEPRGAVDLGDGEEDVQPIERYQEFGGYLGQGRLRQVMVPAKSSGKRFFADEDADVGVYQDFVGLDGTYGQRSAKQMFWVKTPLIPVAKQVKPPEDGTGDDARADNYKASGKFGGGEEHKVGDVKVDGDERHLLTVAGVMDLLSYAFNWQACHPFHYHAKDYHLPQEEEVSGSERGASLGDRAQDVLDFSELQSKPFMSYPTPRKVKVDDRYGEVEYFARTAYHAMLPDGGQVWGDGYGAEVVMSGGKLKFSAPGGIEFAPGTDFTVLAGRDVVLRAYNSLDATAGKGALTLKGEKLTQILGGNEQGGGVLIESKSPGFYADFDDKVGEDVQMGGIIFKAPKSAVVAWAGDIYLRTGGPNMNKGSIVLDADRGQGNVISQGNFSAFAQDTFGVFLGPAGDSDNVKAVHLFTASGAVIDKGLAVQGVTSVTDTLDVGGAFICQGPIGAVQNNGGFVGKIPQDSLDRTQQQVSAVINGARRSGQTAHRSIFSRGLYQANQIGNDDTIKQAAFSYRDDPDGKQYRATQFKLAESRWQQMARLGGGTGGEPWDDEPTVSYQGRELLPYPGKRAWTEDETLVQIDGNNMFDVANGRAVPRPGPYTDPKLGGLKAARPSEAFMIVKS